MSYNGWSNYETWVVKLWIDNEQGTYNYWCERTQEALQETEACQTFTHAENAANYLQTALKEDLYYEHPLSGDASMYSNLLQGALSDVNWREIAKSMIENELEHQEHVEEVQTHETQ